MESDKDLLRLDEQVCFALSVAARTVVSMYGPHLAPLGLTHPQYLVLLTLWEEDGRRQGDIAQTVRLEPATVSPLLARLERAGLITRHPAPEDVRSRIVRLTDAGRALRADAEHIPHAILEELQMDTDELADLRDRLFALVARVELDSAEDC